MFYRSEEPRFRDIAVIGVSKVWSQWSPLVDIAMSLAEFSVRAAARGKRFPQPDVARVQPRVNVRNINRRGSQE
jgi:hypothetical protein